MNKIKIFGFTILVSCYICSCTKPDFYYKDLIEGKDIVYPGKISNLSYSSGHNRFALDFTVSKDRQVNKLFVFWNSKQDSIVIDITEADIGQSKQVIVNDVEENTYDFEIYTQNTYYIRSIPTKVTGRVYGDEYIATLNNRAFLQGGFDRGRAWLEWTPESKEEFVYTKISYQTINDEEVVIDMPKTTDWTYLNDYKKGSKVYYQAVFRPIEQTLDVYYSSSNSIIVPE